MKFIFILTISTIGGIFSIFQNISNSFSETNSGNIVVEIDNIEKNSGNIYVGLFNSKKTFRKVNQVYKYKIVEPVDEKATVVLEDVPFSEYAVVIYQDFNGNKKFDQNFIGIPKEPFGFSNNFIVRKSAPKYKQVAFKHTQANTNMLIKLQKF